MSLITKYVFRGDCTTAITTDNGKSVMQISGPCFSCQQPLSVQVAPADYARFERGEFASECFPYLKADEREFLISGICDRCWDEMFGKEEEDGGDDS